MVSAASIEPCITQRTRLIVPVHFAGAAAEMEPIRALARARGIALVEDSAHAVGARSADGPVGRIGTSIFSFHPIKTITTGEGGMICSDDEPLLERIRRLKFHGLGVDAWERTSQGRAPQSEVLEPGFKYNMTDVAAALGLGQLDRLDEFIERRQALAALYEERLADVDEILPLRDSGCTARHARSLYPVRLDTDSAPIDRDGLMLRLKERNIGTGLHFRAVHEHAYYHDHPHRWRGELPHTEWNSARILSLPLFPAMNEDDVEQVVDEIKEALAR
jgi:UDP-4-amino-4-deoxy-L-arabinose-oxoglutarate aminotransferase